MATENLVELTGTILHLHDQGTSTEIAFSLLDEDGRIMAIGYEYEDRVAAESIYNSLKDLAKPIKVKILIEGPVSDKKATYRGVGIITLLNDKKDRAQNI